MPVYRMAVNNQSVDYRKNVGHCPRMAEAPYMQFYVADYLGDTQHLTTEQHGAYLLLLMTMWRAGGRLPNDPKKLARICRVDPRRWRAISPDVMEFFRIDGAELTQSRLERELKNVRSISQVRSENGARGGAAKALKTRNQGLANATVLPQQNAGISEPESEPELKKEGAVAPSKEIDRDDSRAELFGEVLPPERSPAPIAAKRGKAKKQRLPDDWAPTLEDRAYAEARGFSSLAIDREADKFRNNHTARGSVMVNWSAAWKSWIGRAQEWSRPMGPTPLRPSATDTAIDGLFLGYEQEMSKHG